MLSDLRRLLQSHDSAEPVWAIRDLKSEKLGTHTEVTWGGIGRLEMSVADDMELVRVTAKVRNMSSESDPPYAPWTKNPLVMFLFEPEVDWWVDKQLPRSSNRRLACDNTVFLLADGVRRGRAPGPPLPTPRGATLSQTAVGHPVLSPLQRASSPQPGGFSPGLGAVGAGSLTGLGPVAAGPLPAHQP